MNGYETTESSRRKALRQQVIYSVFVRNYSEAGTFEAVRQDLDRIQDLGTDIIWLMPIHPCGKEHRKGTLGSPYAIRDYRDVNPEFGTKEDFRRLVDSIHEKGMKVIIDVVYNHTSPDSALAKTHPEWFYHKADGSFGNKTGDWWDVIDLDYGQKGLWQYQIDTLKMWAGEYQVDGFRCDVAPMVPVAFWKEARAAVETVHPGAIWLAETVEPEFIAYNRMHGIYCASDAEIFQAFDMSYEYDVYWKFEGYLSGQNSLAEYAEALNRQETMYPDAYDKLRFLENHDRLRAHFLIRDEKRLRNWTAFCFFRKGTTLIYNGQEAGAVHTPGLFDKDTIRWDELDHWKSLQQLMRRMSEIRKNPVFADSTWHAEALPHEVLLAQHTANAQTTGGKPGTRMIGIFCMTGEESVLHVGERNSDLAIPDGRYRNLIDGSLIEVNMGEMAVHGEPVVFSPEAPESV